MVERIPKLETDTMRVDRKEEAADEREDQSKRDQSDKEEQDEFAPKLDFKKWTGKRVASSQGHQSLWDRKLSAHPVDSERPEAVVRGDTSAEEGTVEEPTTSTTITFLRAVGMLNRGGTLQWGTITLYVFTIIGLLIVITMILNALL